MKFSENFRIIWYKKMIYAIMHLVHPKEYKNLSD